MTSKYPHIVKAITEQNLNNEWQKGNKLNLHVAIVCKVVYSKVSPDKLHVAENALAVVAKSSYDDFLTIVLGDAVDGDTLRTANKYDISTEQMKAINIILDYAFDAFD